MIVLMSRLIGEILPFACAVEDDRSFADENAARIFIYKRILDKGW